MVEIKLPKRTISKDKDLYAVEIVDYDGEGRVKINYVGYSSCHDEWRDEAEIVPIEPQPVENSMETDNLYTPFSLYNELGSRIKSSLMSQRKESPTVRIELPFDKVLFEGELKACGKELRHFCGVQRYKITKYADLNPLLGQNWHLHGINSNGDFCYVILSTLEYYLHKCEPLKEYFPSASGSENFILKPRDLGDMLTFIFVRGDGTREEFGDIF